MLTPLTFQMVTLFHPEKPKGCVWFRQMPGSHLRKEYDTHTPPSPRLQNWDPWDRKEKG